MKLSTLDQKTISFDDRLAELEAQKAQRMKDKGYLPLYKWEEGENRFELKDQPPRRATMNDTEKFVYRIIVDGEEFDAVFASAIETEVLKQFKAGKSKLCLLRMGKGNKTRYKLKEE